MEIGGLVINRKEVAKLAGVSEATVSRVLNNVGPIADRTRQRVLEAARQLNYHPSAIAQSFVKRKSGNIGVILPYVPKVHIFSTYYFSEILSGIGEQVKRNGYDLLLLFLTPEEELNYAQYFQKQKIDACIILGARDVPQERKALLELERGGYPFCLVNQRFEGCRYYGVDADHVTGSYEAVRHLAEQGAKDIAFVNGPMMYSNSADRLEGYRRALEEAGLPYRPERVFEGNYSRKSGYSLSASLTLQGSRPDAVFAANDRMAIGLLQGWKEKGLEAGRDIALAGYDDSDAAKLTGPPLTSVDVPFFEMGGRAVEHLIRQMQAHSESIAGEPFYEILPTRLMVRPSSKFNPRK
ncbi:LacI family DNA-binding transcriptional regulator [Paenibacillus gansuensis]|uniref:LacI family DNA-binding transcriptional regulator n=1 Tax=Paenibacillus gansuensis TaxID=306542 RepID=A0ABW5PKR8_9BACL